MNFNLTSYNRKSSTIPAMDFRSQLRLCLTLGLLLAMFASTLTGSPVTASSSQAVEGHENNDDTQSHSIAKRASNEDDILAKRYYDGRKRTKNQLADFFNSVRTRSPPRYVHLFVGKRGGDGNYVSLDLGSPEAAAIRRLLFIRYVRSLPNRKRTFVGKRRITPLSLYTKRLTSELMARDFPAYDHKFIGKRSTPLNNDDGDFSSDATLDEENDGDLKWTGSELPYDDDGSVELEDGFPRSFEDNDLLTDDLLDLRHDLFDKGSTSHSRSKRDLTSLGQNPFSADSNQFDDDSGIGDEEKEDQDGEEGSDLNLLRNYFDAIDVNSDMGYPLDPIGNDIDLEEDPESDYNKVPANLDDFLDKRYQNFHSLVGKRQSYFHSLVGKRAPGFHALIGKRAPGFHSLVGKRAPGFHALVGKRAPGFHSLVGKRAPGFHSLVGKRAPGFHALVGKRAPGFHALVGKRAPGFHALVGKRDAYFHSLVGKRTSDFDEFADKRDPGFHSLVGKRNSYFHSLVGKRDFDLDSLEDKRAPGFHALVGKRAPGFHSLVGKRETDFNSLPGEMEPDFTSFAEKRGYHFHSLVGKRSPGFHSLVGKRSLDLDSFEAEEVPNFQQATDIVGDLSDTQNVERGSMDDDVINLFDDENYQSNSAAADTVITSSKYDDSSKENWEPSDNSASNGNELLSKDILKDTAVASGLVSSDSSDESQAKT